MAKRTTSNAEMRENGLQPFGLPPENSACCVAVLKHGTTMPFAQRLATTIFRGNGGKINAETASNYRKANCVCAIDRHSYV